MDVTNNGVDTITIKASFDEAAALAGALGRAELAYRRDGLMEYVEYCRKLAYEIRNPEVK